MRDKSTTNWFGENIDEQEKRRQWLRGVLMMSIDIICKINKNHL